jgi:pyruvate/2-oxoglutarate dehydrogenase complex dihydrolipoamide acyltransferase (E2) component
MAMAVKQTPKEASEEKPTTPSKADLIRRLVGLPAKEVVEKAKEAGVTLSEDYVYKLRSADRSAAAKASSPQKAAPKKAASKKAASKKAAAAPKAAAAKPAPAASPSRRPVIREGSLEETFVDLALNIGLSRTEELLVKLRNRVKNIALA